MSTWECRECTAAYAPDAPACPHCRANDPIEEAEQLRRENEAMPKITVHGGPSNADTGEGMPESQSDGVESTEVPVDDVPAVEETPVVEDTEPEKTTVDEAKPRATRKSARS